ncbi:MAG: hypothetical protein JNL10_06710 [Verrucomicrobiales bacterium]|nr:hypothetical protein [Verrucomicrobiales bacterium]
MDSLVVGLLVSLASVLCLAFLFFLIYRTHLRRLRFTSARNRADSPASERRDVSTISVPVRWMAIRSANTPLVREVLGVADEVAVPWSESLSRAAEDFLFVSGPVDGWTLVVGGRIPDPAQDVDAVYRWLNRLSRELGEVHFYSADRVLHFHSWVRMDDGRVTRAYAWAGETQWNEGRPTLEERLLGFRCRAYCEAVEPVAFGEVAPEVRNTERVVLLARRWSLDPVVASRRLVQKEAVRSEDEDGTRG